MSYVPYKALPWTQVVTLTGAGTAPQYLTKSATYTRVGRVCFFNIYLHGDGGTEGSGAGVITVSLPFKTSSKQLEVTINAGTVHNGATVDNIYISYAESSSTMTLKRQQSANILTDFTGADQNNADRGIHLMGKILTDE